MAFCIGPSFSLVTTNNGDIYSFGLNQCGQLGIETTISQRTPQLLSRDTVFEGQDVVMVSAGFVHASCVTSDGSVWLWGFNMDGALGLGDFVNRLAPVRIQPTYFNDSQVLMVACGCTFTIVLTELGRVWTCGTGNLGALGHGDRKNLTTLTEIAATRFGNRAIGTIAAGAQHSLAISREGGILFAWGANSFGQLGLGYWSSCEAAPCIVSPADVGGAGVAFVHATLKYSMAVTVDGVLWACGDGIPGTGAVDTRCTKMICIGGPDLFGQGGVRMVACARDRALIVAWDGNVWCTQQLPFRKPVVADEKVHMNPLCCWLLPRALFGDEDIIVASASDTHCGVVTRTGRLFTWDVIVDHADVFALGYKTPSSRKWWPRAVKTSVFKGVEIGRWHAFTRKRAQTFITELCGKVAADATEKARKHSKLKDTNAQHSAETLDGIHTFEARHQQG